MNRSHLSVTFLGLCVLLTCTGVSNGQFDVAGIINSMNDVDLLKFAMGLIYENKPLLKTLKEVAITAFPILSMDYKPNYFSSILLPWALHKIPDILTNEEVLGILRIFIKEVESSTYEQSWILDTNDTEAQKYYFAERLLSNLDYIQMLKEIARMRSVGNFFPYDSTDRKLNETCYNHTMAFIDRLLMGDDWALNSQYIPATVFLFSYPSL